MPKGDECESVHSAARDVVLLGCSEQHSGLCAQSSNICTLGRCNTESTRWAAKRCATPEDRSRRRGAAETPQRQTRAETIGRAAAHPRVFKNTFPRRLCQPLPTSPCVRLNALTRTSLSPGESGCQRDTRRVGDCEARSCCVPARHAPRWRAVEPRRRLRGWCWAARRAPRRLPRRRPHLWQLTD